MTTDERVSTLESHLNEIRTSEADLRRQLRQARVDHWQDRIDDLEFQVHLGVVDGSERLTQATKTLHSTWDQARAELLDASSDAAAAAETLGARVRGAYEDVRTSLVDAKNTMSR